MSTNNALSQKRNQLYREHEIQNNEVESLARIFQEFKTGFDFLKRYPRSVSFFGSARLAPDSEYSKKAEELAARIVHELKYAVLTGGGPGIMGAANKGAYQAGGQSIGISIRLPQEQNSNPYITSEQKFHYFFTRKTILYFAAEAYIFFPGGFGTFDEFFGVLTLIQTGKIPTVPIFLFGSDFWNPILEFVKTKMLDEYKTVSPDDLKLFTITDDFDLILNTIKQTPISRWWRNIEK